jgi:hypothetical protein
MSALVAPPLVSAHVTSCSDTHERFSLATASGVGERTATSVLIRTSVSPRRRQASDERDRRPVPDTRERKRERVRRVGPHAIKKRPRRIGEKRRMRRCQRLPEVTHPVDSTRPTSPTSSRVPARASGIAPEMRGVTREPSCGADSRLTFFGRDPESRSTEASGWCSPARPVCISARFLVDASSTPRYLL